MSLCDLSPDEWKTALQDVAEIARHSLRNIVNRGIPPLPSSYEREFINVAKILGKYKILEAASNDRENFEKRIEELVNSTKKALSFARTTLEDFGEEARRCFDALDSSFKALETGQGEAMNPAKERQNIRELGKNLERHLAFTIASFKHKEDLLSELSSMVYKDQLTSILNRRSWDKDLEDDLKRAASGQGGGIMTIVMADIDHFKAVNDTHGHRIGDAVLKQFARLLEDHFTGKGKAYRYGGEEFAVSLPGLDLDTSTRTVEEFKKRLNMTTFTADQGRIILKVTASFGLSQWSPGATPDELAEAADRALYEAKNAGRNCIRTAQVLSRAA